MKNNYLSPEIKIIEDKKIDSEIISFAKSENLKIKSDDPHIIYLTYKLFIKILFTDDKILKNRIESNKFSYLNKDCLPIIFNSIKIQENIEKIISLCYY